MHSHPASRLHSYLTMQQSVEGDQHTHQIVLTIATPSAFISVLVRVRQEVLEEGSTIASRPLWTTWMEMEFVDERDCYTYVLFIKKGSWCRSISILSLWVLFYIIIIYHHQTCWLTQYCFCWLSPPLIGRPCTGAITLPPATLMKEQQDNWMKILQPTPMLYSSSALEERIFIFALSYTNWEPSFNSRFVRQSLN